MHFTLNSKCLSLHHQHRLHQGLWGRQEEDCGPLWHFLRGRGSPRWVMGWVYYIILIIEYFNKQGGILFGFLGSLTVRRGRDPIILLGFVVSIVSYFLIFINLPFSAPLRPTPDLGRLPPSSIPESQLTILQDISANLTHTSPTSLGFSWAFLMPAS